MLIFLKKMKKMKKVSLISAALFFILISLSSCSSVTMIKSEPNGAKVYLNDNYVGNTPYKMEDSKISFSRTFVRIEKDGYKTLETYITKDEDVNVGAIVGGVIFWFPFLWTMSYMPEHIYELTPTNEDEKYYYNDNNEGQKNQSSKYQQLIDLKKLLDEGIITQEEYEKEKQKVLNQ